MKAFAVAACLCAALAGAAAEEVPLEYQVKAAYLLNFTRFVEWPPAAFADGAFNICVAGSNPFGGALGATLAGETAAGRMLVARVVNDPSRCHVLFVPRGVAAAPFLRSVGSAPVLTVGESANFLDQGGIVNFVIQQGKVRFAINYDAAARSNLKISSRLLRLAAGAGQG